MGSSGHLDFLADSEAVRVRGEWLVVMTIKDPNNNPLTIRFSRRGTGTGRIGFTIGAYTIPPYTPFYQRLLTAPSISQSLWQGNQIQSSSLPSFGNMLFDNSDGGLDQYRPSLGYTWVGQPCQVFFCDCKHIDDTVGIVFDGTMGDPSFTLAEMDLPLQGREEKFKVPLSSRVYRGTSYQLELFGDRTVTFGSAPTKLNITGDITIKGWLWIDALPSADRVWFGWFQATTYPYRLILKTTGGIEWQSTVGGSVEQKIPTAVLAVKKPYYFVWTVSGSTPTFRLWDDDAQTWTSQVLSNFSGARQSAAGGTPFFVIRTASDATLTPWHDEFQIFNYAQTLSEIESGMFRPLVSSPATCVFRVGFDDGAGTTVTDSSASPANGVISGAGTSTWLWAMEGDASLAGTPKMNIWGKRGGVRPILVHPLGNVWQVAGGGSVQSIQSYVGGGAHTMNATYASMRALMVASAPAAGTATPYLARGYFKLNTAPSFPVSALVEGYNGGPLGYVSTTANITQDIVTRFGPKLSDPSEIDTASFTALNTADSSVNSYVSYDNSPEGTLKALNSLHKGSGSWHGYVRGSNLYHVERFEGPSVTPEYQLDQRRIDKNFRPFPPQAVIYEVVVGYRPSDVVLDEGQVTTPPKGTTDWTQWTKSYLEVRATDAEVRARFPGSASRVLYVETGLYNESDAQRLAEFLLGILKGQKEGWSLTLDSSGLQMTPGETLTAEFKVEGVARLLDGVKKYCILQIEDVGQRGEVRVDIWG